jgi:hypothetical protein
MPDEEDGWGSEWGPEKLATGNGPRHRHPVMGGGLREGLTHSHAGAAPRHWHDGDEETRSIGLSPMLGRFETVLRYYRKVEREKRRVLKTKPAFVRHVSFAADGKGATFELHKRGDRAEWTWEVDPGVHPDLAFVRAPFALAEIEKELGMPITFPYADPDKRREGETEPRELG